MCSEWWLAVVIYMPFTGQLDNALPDTCRHRDVWSLTSQAT